MRSYLCLVLLLSAGTASAQTLSLRFGEQTSTTVGPSDCGELITANWTFSAGTACDDLDIWVTSTGTCGDTASTGDFVVDSIPFSEVNTSKTGTVTFKGEALPLWDATHLCGQGALEKTLRLCGNLRTPSFGTTCDTDVRSSGTVTIEYDSVPPEPPTVDSVLSQDSALSVLFSVPEDVSQVRVEILEKDAPAGTAFRVAGTVDSTQSRLQVGSLTNGQTYLVRAIGLDAAGNESVASNVVEGLPKATTGFYQAYRDAGGAETGGCSAVGGSAWATLALAAVGLWRLARKES